MNMGWDAGLGASFSDGPSTGPGNQVWGVTWMPWDPAWPAWSTKLVKIRPATNVMVLTEWCNPNNWAGGTNCAAIFNPFNSIDGTAMLPHGRSGRNASQGKANYLFADGHVETRAPVDTLGPTGTLGYPRGGIWTRRPVPQ